MQGIIVEMGTLGGFSRQLNTSIKVRMDDHKIATDSKQSPNLTTLHVHFHYNENIKMGVHFNPS